MTSTKRYLSALLPLALLAACIFHPTLAFMSERKLDVAVHPNLVVFHKNFPPCPSHSTTFTHLLSQATEEEDAKTRKQTALLNSSVGGLVLAGGIAGFVRKGSKASLMAGSTFGGILLASAALILNKKSIGYKLASVASLLLTFIMGKKYYVSGVYMPSGVIATAAAIAFVYNSVDTLVSGSVEETDEKEGK